jgi:hypothetical protein
VKVRIPQSQLDADPSASDDEDNADDDYKTKLKRRLKKAKAFLSSSDATFRLCVTLQLIQPLHACMVTLIRHKDHTCQIAGGRADSAQVSKDGQIRTR